MNNRFIILIVIASVLVGCSGSDSSTESKSTENSGPVTSPTDAPGTVQTPLPAGKFTVQIGAYQSEESAKRIASAAEGRFTQHVYTVYNPTDALYKVMLGAFDTKEDARSFRDTIVRQYPEDYRDAWVSTLSE